MRLRSLVNCVWCSLFCSSTTLLDPSFTPMALIISSADRQLLQQVQKRLPKPKQSGSKALIAAIRTSRLVVIDRRANCCLLRKALFLRTAVSANMASISNACIRFSAKLANSCHPRYRLSYLYTNTS